MTALASFAPCLRQHAEPVKPPPAKASSFDFGGKNVFDHAIPNAEGKSMVAILVNYPPGGKSPPHRRAPSAVDSTPTCCQARSAARSTMNPLKPTKPGVEGFSELPGARHRISENASDERPATMSAVHARRFQR